MDREHPLSTSRGFTQRPHSSFLQHVGGLTHLPPHTYAVDRYDAIASVLPDVAWTSASHAHGWNCMARAQHSGVGVADTSIGFSHDWVAMASFWDWIWPTKGAHGEPGSCGGVWDGEGGG